MRYRTVAASITLGSLSGCKDPAPDYIAMAEVVAPAVQTLEITLKETDVKEGGCMVPSSCPRYPQGCLELLAYSKDFARLPRYESSAERKARKIREAAASLAEELAPCEEGLTAECRKACKQAEDGWMTSLEQELRAAADGAEKAGVRGFPRANLNLQK